ncbi:alpha/beta fold hydrolase [Anoxybacillus rupiensis]|uniref:alpha/beta fold hydrolase n=1 Tax=Anoxybacteroides rupiense TaxID=311460 RepID=UPI001BAA9677|nr:alpha/beta fold hydrolase [Anoxybacillus rupiensis]MBS2772259.1 alpha/beta fold hydrolase [Anoxybacillus rupiensis]
MEQNELVGHAHKEISRWRNIWTVRSDAERANKTKRISIWKKNKAVLWYYPSPDKKYDIPVFHVYSLVNRASILDLAPGTSLIEGFGSRGYDVYLLDWGAPAYEDKDITLENYIVSYLQQAVKRAIRHSGAAEISLIGYCLGGTMAAIYAAIAEEPIRNLIFIATPVDMKNLPIMNKWVEALRSGTIQPASFFREIGIVPREFIKAGVRLCTVPLYFSHYFSLLQRAHDEAYVRKWKLFNDWTNDHIPFSSAAFLDLMDLVAQNKIINGLLRIKGKSVQLENITANLLVVCTNGDRLIPAELSYPIIEKASSHDKTYQQVEGGHVSFALQGGMPEFWDEWLKQRSSL